MPFPQDQVAWLTANRERLVRWMFLPQLLVALLFLGFAYRTGRTHVRVLLRGAQAQGRIVSLRPVQRSTGSSNTRLSDSSIIYLPLVEFTANGRSVHFEDWKGTRSDSGVGTFVPVLHDPADASTAMLDRGTWNWIPWAPCLAFGALLALVALKGLLSLLFLQRSAALQTSKQSN
jgi:hypothetical protein